MVNSYMRRLTVMRLTLGEISRRNFLIRQANARTQLHGFPERRAVAVLLESDAPECLPTRNTGAWVSDMKSPPTIRLLIIMSGMVALLYASSPFLSANALSASSTTGEIDGQIVLYPAFPVARAGEPNQRGVQGRVAVVDAAGAVVAQIFSDPQGRFRLALAPGHYTLRLTSLRWPASSKPQSVTVRGGHVTKAVLLFDAGIR